MEKTVVIVGAGGKMGFRASEKIGCRKGYRTVLCEKDAERADALRAKGFRVDPIEGVLKQADFVVLAVPDEAIGNLSHTFVPQMKHGSALIALDAAAAYAGQIPTRSEITQVITHPCHPPFFTEQSTHQARADYFGGIAEQDILVSLVEGSEEVFAESAEICKAMFSPVRNVHRVTPTEFALLEPAMSEIIVATAATLMKASLDLAIAKGVPPEAARAFMAGHARIALAIVFGAEKSPFSDAAQVAVRWGMDHVIRPDWQRVFEPETLRHVIDLMLKTKSHVTVP
jgi:NAD(P)-dependent dehydrogenase (short-subunit alcohol dehydrogenase family)